MRGLVAMLVLGLGVDASAKRLVVEEPGVAYRCPTGKSWDEVAKCLTKHGKLTVLQTLANAKLVRLDQRELEDWVDGGVYLYAESKKQWKVIGSWFGRGTDYDLELASLRVGMHAGYRIDVHQATPMVVSHDGVTHMPALQRTTGTLFCSGVNQCAFAMRTCEVLIDGGAYWTFRGTMQIDGNEVRVAGDRRHEGPFCKTSERVFLGWPQQ